MDLERARVTAQRAAEKSEAERERLENSIRHQRAIDRYNEAWNAWAATWQTIAYSREGILNGEAGQVELAAALTELVDATREHRLLDSVPVALERYDPSYCDGTDDEEEAHAVGILIDALNDLASGRSSDEVASDILSLDPLPLLFRAGSARYLLRIAARWPNKCERCGRVQPPRTFDNALCRPCSETEGKLVQLVSYIDRVERATAGSIKDTAEAFPFWPRWRKALLRAYPGVTRDSELCRRWAEYLTERQSLERLRWQWISFDDASQLLPPPLVCNVENVHGMERKGGEIPEESLSTILEADAQFVHPRAGEAPRRDASEKELENTTDSAQRTREIVPYQPPEDLPEDLWIYSNIHRNSFADLRVEHSEWCQSQKKKPYGLSRNGYKARADRYAKFHGLQSRRFKGSCECCDCQPVTDTQLSPD